MTSTTPTLIAACRQLAVDIESPDGVANAALHEIADRLDELDGDVNAALITIRRLVDLAGRTLEGDDDARRRLAETVRVLEVS